MATLDVSDNRHIIEYSCNNYNLSVQTKRNNEMRTELAKLIDTEAALLDLRHNVDRQREVEDAAIQELERARTLLADPETTKHLEKGREREPEKDVATEVRQMREQRHGGTVKELGQRSAQGTVDTRNDVRTGDWRHIMKFLRKSDVIAAEGASN